MTDNGKGKLETSFFGWSMPGDFSIKPGTWFQAETQRLRVKPGELATHLQILFGLPLGLKPSTSYSIHYYISSTNHSFLFATHAHTITTCFVVVSRLCHLFLVSLSAHYLEICLLPKRHTPIWPFSSLINQIVQKRVNFSSRWPRHPKQLAAIIQCNKTLFNYCSSSSVRDKLRYLFSGDWQWCDINQNFNR